MLSFLFSLAGTYTESFFFPHSVVDSVTVKERKLISTYFHSLSHLSMSIFYLQHKANGSRLWTVHFRLKALEFFEFHTPKAAAKSAEWWFPPAGMHPKKDNIWNNFRICSQYYTMHKRRLDYLGQKNQILNITLESKPSSLREDKWIS